MGICIQHGDLFYSVDLHRNQCQPQPTQEKIRRFWKNADEWTRRVEISKKKSLAASVVSMAIYWPTQGFKGRTSKLCVLTRWDFNFYVHSSPLREVNAKDAFCVFISNMIKHMMSRETDCTENNNVVPHNFQSERRYLHHQTWVLCLVLSSILFVFIFHLGGKFHGACRIFRNALKVWKLHCCLLMEQHANTQIQCNLFSSSALQHRVGRLEASRSLWSW